VTTAARPARVALPRPSKPVLLGIILGVWVAGWSLFQGRSTLALGPAELTPLHLWLNDVNNAIGASRATSPLFLYVLNPIRVVIDAFVGIIQALISQPALGRPVPLIGWLGVVAIATWLSWVFGNARVALLACLGFLCFGLQGLWTESMDTLALTIAAVAVALAFGIPLGVWAGVSDRVERTITPGLDFMQTMPTFVYLAPLTLFFLIGPASATIATLIYAAPPVIRITAHGIRSVSPTTVEAATSMGATRRQTLTKVLLPMSRRTIVLGVNQTIMAALAMVTIAALIDAPGLGKTVLNALESLDVGTAFNGGLAIVVMAIVLDRVTTAAAAGVDPTRSAAQRATAARLRKPLLVVTGVATLVCVWFSYTYLWAAEFPDTVSIGPAIARAADAITVWAQTSFAGVTNTIREVVTVWLLNPFESLLTDSPWWLVAGALVAIAAVLGGGRAAVTTAICVVLIIATGLWSDSMTTLASTLVATTLVMAFGVVVGVWMGRDARADRVVRPFLDAGQVMPPFVYLVPILALFSPSRFTAIVAAVVFGAPVAIKIIADGIRAVSPTTVEASVAAGSNTWQTISKVQLPMSRRALTLATNQGLIYVLSMVVVGGLVGAGALGYDVVAGFSQSELFGKGLAAGFAIVLLGVMLDRISQAAARRQ